MNDGGDLLRRLAEAHGLALDYHDIWGNHHRVDDDALRALLAAMRVPALSDVEVRAALQAIDDAKWASPLPPLSVLRTNARPWTLRVRIAAPRDGASFHWRLTHETGEVAHHPVDPARIATVEQRDGDVRRIALDVDLAVDLAMGYYRIALLADEETVAEGDLAVAPPACYRPPALAIGGRAWGAAVQVYALRSARNWGIGDYSDLADLAATWGEAGADVVGVNPMHALFPHDPARASPYSPSSRLFLNPLYVDAEAIPEFRDSPRAREVASAGAFRDALEDLREAPRVRYREVAAAKHRVLQAAFDYARRADDAKGRQRRTEFATFKATGGEALRRHAQFEALQEHFHAADPSVWGWPAWPEAYRDPASPQVRRFAEEHADRVDYFAWLQWQAAQQRARVAARAREAGMAIGLYTDLAVSVDRGGAETWSNQSLYAVAASVGAPPDAFNVNGQDWGLPPLVPSRLAAAGFAPFLATLRANMRDAGALRIDHVMGLFRLFWVPPGERPSRGAYVRYPSSELLGLLALESHRHRCAVIGEDLGTVPDEVRAALAANDVLSYRVLMFEREGDGTFKPPRAYPEPALATVTTHDLPTLAGWWEGHDIALRAKHGMLGEHPDVEGTLRQRAHERSRLVEALVREGLLPEADRARAERVPLAPAAALAVQRYLARATSALMVVQPDDVLGVREPANLPGTSTEHPNWQRKLPDDVDDLARDPRFAALAAALRAERPRAHAPAAPADRPTPRRGVPPAPPAVPLPLDAVPRSTYRLQLHRGFTFRDVTALVPYFRDLGVSHLYLSPYLRARPGSRHGYDVVDHGALNPEIGSPADFDALTDALKRHGLQHICDVVPNHMAILGQDNRWWMDVLQHGPASAYATHFDIDWTPPDASLRGKVLVPVLGKPYGAALEGGELALAFEPAQGTFAVRYYEHRLPLDPRTYPEVLARVDDGDARAAPDIAALRALGEAWRALPARDDADPARAEERRARSDALAAGLARMVGANPALGEAIHRAVARLNGTPGDPASFGALDALLEAQAWRPAFWRVAGDEINYRRFFDVNELAGLRTERDDVFAATHDFLLGLAADGRIGGLRIDHPDGLRDPSAYFARLQARYRELAQARGRRDAAGVYVVVEKICAPHEPLPADWQVHGDTGYVFANAVNAVLVDPTARARIERVWQAFVGDEAAPFEQVSYQGKRSILDGPLASALVTLTGRALAIARSHRHTRDFTFSILRAALEETAACFPVYRTYVSCRGPGEQDRRYIEWAVSRAQRTGRVADPSVFDFVRALLLAEPPDGADAGERDRWLDFALAFQQFTAPTAAKGVEDTAFYRHTRLVSLNEVGGDPAVFGMTRRAFHRTVQERFLRWPWTLLATSTHDNKRSEDVRARLDAIPERAGSWALAVRRWSRMNRSRKRVVDGRLAPSRSDEYLLYQTLVGTFPVDAADGAALEAYRQRIEAYAIKAAREAKVHTSWIAVGDDYEAALAGFVSALLAPRAGNRFVEDLAREAAGYAWYGWLNSLSMTLLKCTVPGVPDLYQGNEGLDFSLVDPDNRRAVDFASRQAEVGRLQAMAKGGDVAARVKAMLDEDRRSDAKLWLTLRALAFRNAHPALVAEGDYAPLSARGPRARHVLAFARQRGGRTMVVVAGRLFASLDLPPGRLPLGDAAWGDTMLDAGALPDGTVLTDALTGTSILVTDGRLPLAALFASFPGALLVSGGAP